ncbi:DUF1573 domain-containing protein [Flavobacterium longum]|uniref:DUF1573 domain-containing protein n=1 Tax=Flavobacterium longum TaxID=1299340 RepID=UPI0039EAC2B9
MKTLKISLLALTFGLMSFNSGNTITDPFVKTAAISAVSWKSDMIEVGEIQQNQPKNIEFEFTNTGKTDIVITNVRPTCGCTVADYTKTPIKPGEKGKVNATFNAAVKGAFTKTITVTTNAEETPKSLTFKGTVI